jgi:hypothetical protein
MENSSSWIRRSNRLIRMVSELHRMGYQLLRIMPYEYPLAWRMSIAPKDVFSVEHGARLVASTYDWPSYSSAQENRYFDWQDASQDNARGLANKFITRFPEVANAGRGRDWEYAGWLDELLGVMGCLSSWMMSLATLATGLRFVTTSTLEGMKISRCRRLDWLWKNNFTRSHIILRIGSHRPLSMTLVTQFFKLAGLATPLRYNQQRGLRPPSTRTASRVKEGCHESREEIQTPPMAHIGDGSPQVA